MTHGQEDNGQRPAGEARADAPLDKQPGTEDKGEHEPEVLMTVTLEKTPFEERGKKYSDTPLIGIRLNPGKFASLVSDMPQFKVSGTDDDKKWFDFAVEKSQLLQVFGGLLEAAIRREGSNWHQYFEYEGRKVTMGKPSIEVSTRADTVLTGQAAIQHIQRSMNLGSMNQVPCIHSGVWVTFNPPTEHELLTLDSTIANEKIAMGRGTNGLIFSNESVYVIRHLVDFMIDHIYSTNIKDFTPEKFRQLILLPDLPILALGLAAAIYPDGYDWSTPCTANPEKCRHVSEERINLGKLLWIDWSAMTPEQTRHMALRGKDHKWSVEQIENYQKQGIGGEGKNVRVNENIQILMKAPNIQSFIESGMRWVSDITVMVNKVVTMPAENNLEEKEYNDYLKAQQFERHARLSSLRQYSPWIREVRFQDNTLVNNVVEVDHLMDLLSGNDDVVIDFFKSIKKYIDDSTNALVAYPVTTCPACQTKPAPTNAKHPDLIPMDAITLFFILKDRRLFQVRKSAQSLLNHTTAATS